MTGEQGKLDPSRRRKRLLILTNHLLVGTGFKSATKSQDKSTEALYTELEGQDRYDIIGPSAEALKGTSSMRLLRERVTGKVLLAKFINTSKASFYLPSTSL